MLTSSGDWGIGGIARFRTSSNVTEAAYGTVKKDWIVRGKQMFGENLWLEYSYNGYMDEWFFGDRIPGRLVQLVYDKNYHYDKGMHYRHRFSGGYATDGDSHWGTGRFRYQGQFSQTLISRINKERGTGFHLGYNIEGAATVYGNGETQALIRGGPFIRTELKNWVSHIGYNMGGVHGDSPFYFDKYMYGKQNFSMPSRFLKELGYEQSQNDVLSSQNYVSNRYEHNSYDEDYAGGYSYSIKKPTQFDGSLNNFMHKSSATSKKDISFANGDRVFHSNFGVGYVVFVDYTNRTAKIDFEKFGNKVLSIDFAPLKKL